jgi:hypothetical protein
MMNTPTPSSAARLVDALSTADKQAPAIVSVPSEARAAANDDTHAPHDRQEVNPLWMITVAFGILIGVMALVLATS